MWSVTIAPGAQVPDFGALTPWRGGATLVEVEIEAKATSLRICGQVVPSLKVLRQNAWTRFAFTAFLTFGLALALGLVWLGSVGGRLPLLQVRLLLRLLGQLGQWEQMKPNFIGLSSCGQSWITRQQICSIAADWNIISNELHEYLSVCTKQLLDRGLGISWRSFFAKAFKELLEVWFMAIPGNDISKCIGNTTAPQCFKDLHFTGRKLLWHTLLLSNQESVCVNCYLPAAFWMG